MIDSASEALAFLKQFGGAAFSSGVSVAVTKDLIKRFAEATGDFQWIHIDESRAANGPYSRLVAHGYLVLSLIPKLTRFLETEPMSHLSPLMAINYGLDKVRFISPVLEGATIQASTVIANLRHHDRHIDVFREISIALEGAEKCACIAHPITRIIFSKP